MPDQPPARDQPDAHGDRLSSARDALDLTGLLREASQGDRGALDTVFQALRERLREEARRVMVRVAPGADDGPTAIMHEAYIRTVEACRSDRDRGPARYSNREHFASAMAVTMMNLLIDSARRRGSDKHGGGLSRVELVDEHLDVESPTDFTLFLEQAIEALAARDEKAAELMKYRYFGGLTWEEAGSLLGLSVRDRKRKQRALQDWLRIELEGRRQS